MSQLRLAELVARGHDAVHVRSLGMSTASDPAIPAVAEDLESGAIVVLADERIRVRRLPLRPLD